ncbi:Origin specific replication initiation factor [Vibrio variabilis]|uniref:Origin specific replication initiation factor n=1 Tax=Vibrio variabilis TaxID=990271 RepID=A0ABQ0JHE1_9VIBR|nr:Origin specific replication initiation factor [Vibrio variabilis]
MCSTNTEQLENQHSPKQIKIVAECNSGFVKFPNLLLECLARTKMNGSESRVFHAVVRKTIGYNQEFDWISNTQLSALTGIASNHAGEALKKLKARNILLMQGRKIGLNMVVSEWKGNDLKTDMFSQETLLEWSQRFQNSGVCDPETGSEESVDLDDKVPSHGTTIEYKSKKDKSKDLKGDVQKSEDSDDARVSREMFEIFYDLYPNHRSLPLKLAKKVWDTSVSDVSEARKVVEWLIGKSENDPGWMPSADGQYVPSMRRFLNEKRWLFQNVQVETYVYDDDVAPSENFIRELEKDGRRTDHLKTRVNPCEISRV